MDKYKIIRQNGVYYTYRRNWLFFWTHMDVRVDKIAEHMGFSMTRPHGYKSEEDAREFIEQNRKLTIKVGYQSETI